MPIPNPPIVTQLTTPVPQRKDPANFRPRADVTMTELPVLVDDINRTMSWFNTNIGVANDQMQQSVASAAAAASSQSAAASSASSASSSRTSASASASSALASKNAAATSESNAGQSEYNASLSAQAAASSESNAKQYADSMSEVIAGATVVSHEDTATIAFSGIGTPSNPLKANFTGDTTVTYNNTPTIEFSGNGTVTAPLSANFVGQLLPNATVRNAPLVVDNAVSGTVKFADKGLGAWAYTSPFSTVFRGRAVVIDGSGNLTFAKARLGEHAYEANTPIRVMASNVTATAYQTVGINTFSASRTVTLPSSPEPGQWVRFFDSHASWDKNNPTIARNGSRIMGKLENMTVDIKGRNFTLTYIDATNGWMITA